MKSLNTIILAMLCSLCFKAYCQAPLFGSNCGLVSYSYDAAGNRILRTIIQCGGGGEDDISSVPNPTNISPPDSSALPKVDSTISQVELQLYPNPTDGKFLLVFNTSLTNATIIISNNIGQRVYQAQTSGQEFPLDLTGYASGVYFVTVQIPKQNFQQQVVKQ